MYNTHVILDIRDTVNYKEVMKQYPFVYDIKIMQLPKAG